MIDVLFLERCQAYAPMIYPQVYTSIFKTYLTYDTLCRAFEMKGGFSGCDSMQTLVEL